MDGTGPYPRITMKTNPGTHGIYLSAVDVEINNPIMSLAPNTSQWTDEISLLIEEAVEPSRRIYDETQRKNRFCLPRYGRVGRYLSGTVGGSAPFYLSLPFEAPSIALLSDFACDTTPACDVFEQPVGTKTVFNYPNMGQISNSDFHRAGNTALVSNYLRLSQYKQETNAAFTKAQILDPNDSFDLNLLLNLLTALRVAHGIVGDGRGMAMVSPWY